MTTAGWPSCAARSAAWIARRLAGDVAAAGALERGADLRGGQLRAPRPGPGPWPAAPGRRRRPGPRTPPARRGSSRAARAAAAGRCRVRSQISVLCVRATTLTASRLRGCPPATGAQLVGVGAHHVGQHVRVAGVALGAGHACRSRYRAACSGLTANTVYPAATSAGHPRAAVGLDPDPTSLRRPRRPRRAARRSARAAGRSRPRPRAAAPWPAAGPPRPSARRRDGRIAPGRCRPGASSELPVRLSPQAAQASREGVQGCCAGFLRWRAWSPRWQEA